MKTCIHRAVSSPAIFRQSRFVVVCFAVLATAVVAAVLLRPDVYEAELLSEIELFQGDDLLNQAEEEYLLYQRKQGKARISDALVETRIANVAVAQAPTVPTEPRPSRALLVLALGLVAALGLSIGAGLAQDALSAAVRTPDDLEATLDDVPVLAWIPASRASSERQTSFLFGDIDNGTINRRVNACAYGRLERA